MTSSKSVSSSSSTQFSPGDDAPPRIPRLDSLQHRLLHAKDADGQPIPLLDELLFLLDDPPLGTADRWQRGANLCAQHGIKTSRMSVWRFYRAHILQWRREQNPPPPEPPPDPQEIARLQEQARHLAVQRTLEMLQDPRLTPGQLIAFLQQENQRQKLHLARDQFKDRVAWRRDREKRERSQRMNKQASHWLPGIAAAESAKQFLASLPPIAPHSTP